MKICKLLCQIIIGIIVSFIGFIAFTGYKRGEFDALESLNLDKCKSIPTPNKLSCEDIQSLSDNSLLLTCGNLLDVFKLMEPNYIPYYNYKDMKTRVSKLPKSKKGAIYLLSPDTEYSKPIKLSLTGYVHPDFHPHGMSVITHKNDQFVFIVNHRRDGEFLSVFKVDIPNKKLKYWTSITSDAFLHINNIAIVPDSNGNFYFTNWMKNDPGSFSGMFELFGKEQMKLSSVGFCETPQDFFIKRASKNVKAKCKLVAEKLSDANGIALSNNGKKLFVVNAAHLFEYKVESDNDLSLLNEIDMKYGCDNVNASPSDNKMHVACFPKMITKIAAGMMEVDNENDNKVTGVVIDADNSKIMGSTAVFKVGKYGIIVSVFDHERYLVCEL